MQIPDHLTCLLRNLYAGQEATVRNGHGRTDWFQIGKGVRYGHHYSLSFMPYMQSSTTVDFTSKLTLGSHFLLQGSFPTQGLNPGLLHCGQTLYRLSHQESPKTL